MSTNTVRIVSGDAEFSLAIPHRDFGLLSGPPPFMPGGEGFVRTLGIYDNFTMARGVPKGSKAVRNRHHVIHAGSILLATIRRDLDLLECDYSYSFSCDGKARSSGGVSGFRVRGFFGYLMARPKGFCTLELSEPSSIGSARTVEILDLRNRKTVETDDRGDLRVYRRRNRDVSWNRSLPELIDFLEQSKGNEVVIYHN